MLLTLYDFIVIMVSVRKAGEWLAHVCMLDLSLTQLCLLSLQSSDAPVLCHVSLTFNDDAQQRHPVLGSVVEIHRRPSAERR